jgi:hypothetical protein
MISGNQDETSVGNIQPINIQHPGNIQISTFKYGAGAGQKPSQAGISTKIAQSP